MAIAAESGGAPQAAALKMASPTREVEDLLQILQRDLLEEGAPACVLSPEGEVIYANKAYHRIAGALAEAGALPSQSALGPIPAGTDSSEEHTSELQPLMRISYAVFCLKKNNQHTKTTQ